MEVGPLSRAAMSSIRLSPYPPGYRAAFAFSILLCQQPCELALRLAFPLGGCRQGSYWFTTFRVSARAVRSRLSAGGSPSASGELIAPEPVHAPFGQAFAVGPRAGGISILGLSPVTAFISDSLIVDHNAQS